MNAMKRVFDHNRNITFLMHWLIGQRIMLRDEKMRKKHNIKNIRFPLNNTEFSDFYIFLSPIVIQTHYSFLLVRNFVY